MSDFYPGQPAADYLAKLNELSALAEAFGAVGSAAVKDIPTSGDASTTQVVYGTDTRLTNARPASDVSAWAKAGTKPSYTKSDVGLGLADNTSDADKPVSTAQAAADAVVLAAAALDATNKANAAQATDAEKTAWNAKQASLVSGTNIKTVNGQSLLGSGNVEIDLPTSTQIANWDAAHAAIGDIATVLDAINGV